MTQLGRRDIGTDARTLKGMLPRFMPLTSEWTHAAWSGGSWSSVGVSGWIDVSAFTGAPANTSHIRAYLVELTARDSAAWGTGGLYVGVGPSAVKWGTIAARPAGGDVWAGGTFVCPCDANGDLWYQIAASGANTMDIYLRIWGFWT